MGGVGQHIGKEGEVGGHLLQVVQHQQHRPDAQRERDHVVRRAGGGLAGANGAIDRRPHVVGLSHVGEGHEMHVGVHRALPGDLDCQSRLADPAGAKQGDEPHVGATEQGGQPDQFILAPNQGGGWSRNPGSVEVVQRHGILATVGCNGRCAGQYRSRRADVREVTGPIPTPRTPAP